MSEGSLGSAMIRKVGLKNLIFITAVFLLVLTILLDIYVVEEIFSPLGYLYIILGIVFAIYVLRPLYASRRLVRYYWERTRKNKLALCGLGFIIFLIILALIGPFFTADPTAVNFEDKNIPPTGSPLPLNTRSTAAPNVSKSHAAR